MYVSREVAKCMQVRGEGNNAHVRWTATEHGHHLCDFISLCCRLEDAP